MRTIRVNNGLPTGFDPGLGHVDTISIEDSPMAIGGYGMVFRCVAINKLRPAKTLLVKLFIDNMHGSASQNYETTRRLQAKAAAWNQAAYRRSGLGLVDEHPAFRALPLYSFTGVLERKQEMGFITEDLVSLGFTDFEQVLSDPLRLAAFQRFPVDGKMLLGFQLVSAFLVLEEWHFVHADLKPGALFINLKTTEIALIDYDSGVITESPGDEPLTWGAPNDWVAPELWEQQSKSQKGERIKVDIYSDRWSVAIGIHYLMTGYHPLFYLTELSPRIARQYFSPPNEWPDVDKRAPYFQKLNEKLYDDYLSWVKLAVPKAVRDLLAHTLNYGYNNPVARTPYKTWKLALRSIQVPPAIIKFGFDHEHLVKGIRTTLSWEVSGAHTVVISNGIGSVASSGSLDIQVGADLQYLLTATGFYGEADAIAAIYIYPTPFFTSIMLPAPKFSSRVKIEPGIFSAPRFDLDMRLHGARPFSNRDLFTEDPVNETRKIRFKFLLFYDYIRRRIRF